MMVAVVLLAVVVGISLGLLGGGGSILTVPLLVYVAQQDAKVAIATSLLVVGITSAAGAVSHARAGRVRWRTGLLFGVAGMVGSYGGGRIGSLVDGTVLLIAFAVVMAVTSVAMLRGGGRAAAGDADGGEMAPVAVLGTGVVVGLITGLVGAGGGFVIVPALVLLGGLPMHAAVGTSLVVIAMNSTAGLLGYLSGVSINWSLAAAVTVAAVIGSVIGGRLASYVSQEQLRRGFGWFVAVMSVVVLARELPGEAVGAVVGSPITWGVVAVAAVAALVWWVRHRDEPADPTPAASAARHADPRPAEPRA